MSIFAFALLGLPEIDDLESGQELIRQGLNTHTIRALADHYQVSPELIGRLAGISKATLSRKLKTSSRLAVPEADGIYRLARIFAYAADVFDDRAAAQEWFTQPNRALGGIKPIELLDTAPGTERVEHVLDQIEHSVIS